MFMFVFFFFQAEDGIRDRDVTGVQTCALPILMQAADCDPTDNSRSRQERRREIVRAGALSEDQDGKNGVQDTEAEHSRQPETPFSVCELFAVRFIEPIVYSPAETVFLHWKSPFQR